MAYTAPTVRATGDLITATIWNADIVANLLLSAPAIMTVAGDTLYASAANTPARLAKGTSLQQYRMNVGATAPEWYAAPAARVYSTSAIVVPTGGGGTILDMSAEQYNINGMHSTATNPSRLTCITPGKYLIIGSAQFAANATGYRQLGLLLDGGTNLAIQQTNALTGVQTAMTLSALYALTTGQYIQLYAFHTSSSNLNIEAANSYSPHLAAHWLSP